MTKRTADRKDDKRSGFAEHLGALFVALIVSSSPTSSSRADGSGDPLPAAEAVEITPAFLEKDGAIIGVVTIENRNIFDLHQPQENRWLYRLANGIHVITQPRVIQSQLLFEPGADYMQQSIEESERLLRKNHYIRDAEIEVIRYEDGVVDLSVRTQDVWTLKANFTFGRKGGVNTGGLGIEEDNLLGTGTHIAATYRRTADRDITRLEFANRHVHGSRFTVSGHYASNSDGVDQQLAVFRPFFSLDSQRAGGVTLYQGERVDTLYDRGSPMSEFVHEANHHDAFLGWSKGLRNGWTRRWLAGLVMDRHRFSTVENSALPIALVPDDRQYAYPYIGFEFVEDHFETATNVDQIHRTEDRFLGTRFSARLGYSPGNSVSPTGSLHFLAAYRSAIKFANAETLITGVELSGRLEDTRAENTLLSAYATYHRQQSEHRLFYANLSLATGINLDLDNPILLGGASGLRGYPLRYQGGTGKALLTLEQRFYTDWYPFRLFRVGGAVFFDSGRTWGKNPVGSDNLGLLRNVGLGLRIAGTRSSSGRILHLDLAYPLDGEPGISNLQFLIETRHSF